MSACDLRTGRLRGRCEVRENSSRCLGRTKTGCDSVRRAVREPRTGPYSGAMHAWLDGVLLTDPTGPAIQLSDHGFTVGDGVFEAIKVVDGRPFALELHLDRLTASARGLGLPDVDLARCARGRGGPGPTAPAAGPDPDHRHRRAGPAGLGAWRPPADRRRRGGADGPDAARLGRRDGAVARNEHGALAGLKTTSYAENVVALAEAHRHGATRRSSPTWPVTSVRAPARTSSTSSTASCAPRAWPAAAWPE